jgi:hypothetical protein
MPPLQSTTPPEWWPPADGEPIGEERARELVAYIRQRAPAVLEVAREHLEQRHPGQAIRTYAVPASQLATATLDRHMSRLAIGTVYVGAGGTSVQVTIGLERNGALVADLSRPTDTVQRWVSV